MSRVNIFYLLTLVAVVGGMSMLYSNTRDAYRAVGENNGRLAEAAAVIDRISAYVEIHDCRRLSGAKNKVELVTVKTDSLYMIRSADSKVEFCRY